MPDHPTKLNSKTQARIVALIQAGNYVNTAAAAAGIHKRTLYRWLKRGKEETFGVYRDFAEAVLQAQAEAEQRAVGVVERAAQDNEVVKRKQTLNARTGEIVELEERTRQSGWQAAAWWLERRCPDRWGKRQRMDVTSDAEAVQVVFYIPDNERDPDAIAGQVIEAEAVPPGDERSG